MKKDQTKNEELVRENHAKLIEEASKQFLKAMEEKKKREEAAARMLDRASKKMTEEERKQARAELKALADETRTSEKEAEDEANTYQKNDGVIEEAEVDYIEQLDERELSVDLAPVEEEETN